MNISQKEVSSVVDNLCVFLKIFDEASKCLQSPLPKPKNGIGSTKSKGNLFAQYYNDIIEQPNIQICFSSRFNNNYCFLFIKNFQLHGNQFILEEIVNLNHREIYHLYKNLFYVANKWKLIESNYHV